MMLSLNKRQFKRIFCVSILLFGIFFFFPSDALAQTDFGIQDVNQSELGLGGGDLRLIVIRVINAILGFLGIIAVLITLYGGYMYMTAGGNEEKVEQAKKILINGAIGLVIIFASFAITRFVINKLADATGASEGESADGAACDGLACAGGSGTFGSCIENVFVVKSLTPSQSNTGMNNIVIRAVFSQSVGTPADQVLAVKNTAGASVADLSYQFVPESGKRVLEAVYSLNNAACASENDNPNQFCLPLDRYTVTVNPTVVGENGSPLEFDEVCGGFTPPQSASFQANTKANDTTLPTMSALTILGPSGEAYTGDNIQLVAGKTYPIQMTMTDDRGIGYVRVKMSAKDNPADMIEFYDGPKIGASANPFQLSHEQFFSQGIIEKSKKPKEYALVISAWDIDHNKTEKTATITLVGATCNNKKLDPGEIDVDVGGPCGGGDGSFCTDSAQCGIGSQCVENACVAGPLIQSVNPMDGAVGNWVTILGAHFGTVPGTVEFGSDQAGWRKAAIVVCGPIGLAWKDGVIITKVPPGFNSGDTAGIRMTTAGDAPLSDATTDDAGPKPTYKDPATGQLFADGLFHINDTLRPGLCAVTVSGKQGDIPDGATAAPAETSVVLNGASFGASQGAGLISFGGIQAPAFSWANASIASEVPQSIEPGTVGVTVTQNGQISNGVPFTILPTDVSGLLPQIAGISPTEPTPGSFITIVGSNFGGNGTVYVTSDPNTACSTKNQTGCVALTGLLPAYCGDTWKENQVVVKLDTGLPAAKYFVTLERADTGLASDGKDALTVVIGAPKPSICSLAPSSGPAPLPKDHPGLVFKGVNFTAHPSLYFWSAKAAADNVSQWLVANEKSGILFKPDKDGTEIITHIPMDPATGASMPAGTWPITVVGDNTIQGNSVYYSVFDCREQTTIPTGFQCCQEGPEAGSIKPENTLCAGEVRDAGYVWRFTTGLIPENPSVVEFCEEDAWDTAEAAITYPSPTPSAQWKDGTSICLNAAIGVEFTMGMSAASINTGNVGVYPCGSGALPECGKYDHPLTNLDLDSFTDGDTILEIKKGSFSNTADALSANTWYRVILTAGVQSVPQDIGAGGTASKPLLIQKSLPEFNKGTVAYYYDFKTGTGLCTLEGAFITPNKKTVSVLGPVQKTSMLPFYYFLKGKSSQACTTVNVDGFGWQWTSANIQKVKVALAPDPTKKYTDTRATAEAMGHAPEGVAFKATASADEGSPLKKLMPDALHDIVSNSSTLFVALGDPEVIAFEPNCSESCLNAGISASFNRQMMTDTYAKGFRLYRCEDPNCVGTVLISSSVYQIDTSNNMKMVVSFKQNLTQDTYYLVSLNGTAHHEDLSQAILSLGQLEPPLPGPPLKTKEWVFKTQADGSACAIKNVVVEPHPYTATAVGQKIGFGAIPYSAPNACSKNGQALNPSSYSYAWKSSKPEVASISGFSVGSPTSFCSTSCLPLGSDYTKGTVLAVCGNAVVEAGEDCDIGISGETPGTVCSLSCLRPGNPKQGKNAGECGNKIAEPKNGESCDPGVDSVGKTKTQDPFCTAACVKRGSSPVFDPAKPGYCGDGALGNEEDCDIKKDSTGCSNVCLHTGTPLSAAWCKEKTASAETVLTACASAITVCGNGVIEPGEACEAGIGGATADTCTANCLYQNLCGTSLAECVSGKEGCTKECAFAGSSLAYGVSSLCGDGVVGIGEAPMCEQNKDQKAGAGAVQIVTAIGKGTVTDGKQQTSIQANVVNINQSIAGSAEYTLQCGFTEYDQPVGGTYNNCLNNQNNAAGVGSNSCCAARPVRLSNIPLEKAGLTNATAPVCPNTLVKAVFDGEIAAQSIAGNIVLATGHKKGFVCAAGTDVTSEVIGSLQLAFDNADHEAGFWNKAWHAIKQFFVRLMVDAALAAPINVSSLSVWCDSGIGIVPSVSVITGPDGLPDSIITLALNDVLSFNTVHAVVLRGGKKGVRDIQGVGIKSAKPANPSLTDMWLFQTGSEVCKIDTVAVEPASHLFTAPNQVADFIAYAFSEDGQAIASTPPYSWKWSWQPQQSAFFTVPAGGALSDTAETKIGSTNVAGVITGFAQATVTADLSKTNNQLGKTFFGETQLSSLFCEQPWPAPDQSAGKPYTDSTYNFSFSYCADAGQVGNNTDNLPFLSKDPIVKQYTAVTTTTAIACGAQEDCDDGNSCTIDICLGYVCKYAFNALVACSELGPDALQQLLFFTDQNNDVIGVQIFKNQERLSAAEWFAQAFPDAQPPKDISIDGYDALTDGDNYYINALNVDPEGFVFNNIYLFSINEGAEAGTRKVFEQFIDSLTFNTNVSNSGYCIGKDDTLDYEHACVNDFECFGKTQTVVLTKEVVGQCAADATATWTQTESPTDLTLYDVAFIDEQTGWAVGRFGTVLRTINGGATWGKVPNVPTEKIVSDVFFADKTNGWIVGGGLLYRSTDSGETWKQVSLPQGIAANASFWIGASRGFVAAGNGKILTTEDGGVTWKTHTVGSNPYFDIVMLDSFVGVAVGGDGDVARTEDGGATWIAVETNMHNALRAASFFNVLGFAVGDSGTILRTTDGGKTWSKTTSGITTKLMDVSIETPSDASVVGAKVLLATTNGGGTWNKLTLENPETDHADHADFFGIVILNTRGWIVGEDGLVLQKGLKLSGCVEDSNCLFGNMCIGGVLGNTETQALTTCSADKTKLQRDWRRLSDTKEIQSNLKAYAQKNNTYPDFKSGTFRPYYNASKWASWGSLGSKIGGIKQDPLNVWIGCDPADPATCWNPVASAFICPAHASVYEYKFDPDKNDYTLHAPFEYFDSENTIEAQFPQFVIDAGSFTTERACTPGQTYSAVASQCGDGVVSPGEVCDPPGKVKVEIDPISKQVNESVCSADCKAWTFQKTVVPYTCGNGIVESEEVCDDGSLNGTYGHCSDIQNESGKPINKGADGCNPQKIPTECFDGNPCTNDTCIGEGSCDFSPIAGCVLQCKGLHGAYCGNGKVDAGFELCDWSSASSKLYGVNKANSCGWDCQSYGSYCGDAVLDAGETCDDGNISNADACSDTCQPTKAALCVEEAQTMGFAVIVQNTQATVPVFFTPYGITPSCMDLSGDQICAATGLPCATVSFSEQYTQAFAPDGTLLTENNLKCATVYTSSTYGGMVFQCGKAGASPQDISNLAPGCGNSVIDPLEQCDLGIAGTLTKTGCESSIEYNESCTYCTNQCKLATFDSPAFCGNGKIDKIAFSAAGQPVYESCDSGGGIFAQNDGSGEAVSASCQSYLVFKTGAQPETVNHTKGTLACTNSCQSFDASACLTCHTSFGKPKPSFRLFNPFVTTPTGWQWVQSPQLDLIFKNGTSQLGSVKLFSPSSSQIDVVDPLEVNADAVIPFFSNNLGIETNAQCNATCTNGSCIDGYAVHFTQKGLTPTPGHDFPFSVTGQKASFTNEIMAVPAVPLGEIRIVVRWGGLEKNQGGDFSLGLQSNSFPDQTYLYSDAFPPNSLTPLCTSIIFNDGWVPIGCAPFQKAVNMVATKHSDLFHAQAMAIVTSTFGAGHQPIAVFVQNTGLPVAQFTNGTVAVDVYTYHSGQNNIASFYGPTFTYTLKDASINTPKANSDAKYWHAFTLIRKDNLTDEEVKKGKVIPGSNMVLMPIESIETDLCEVKKNVYAATDCSKVFSS